MGRTTLLTRWRNTWHDRLCRRTAEAILGLHIFGDWLSTQLVVSQATDYGLKPHENELNPLLAPLTDQPFLQLGVMSAVGLSLVGLLAYEDRRLERGESQQTLYGRVVLLVIIVLGAVVVLWNLASAAVLGFELV
jgi:hypothetical protein